MKKIQPLPTSLYMISMLLFAGLVYVLLTGDAHAETRNHRHLAAWAIGVFLSAGCAWVIQHDISRQLKSLQLQQLSTAMTSWSQQRFLSIFGVLWAIYVFIAIILMLDSDVRLFETEGYITSFSIPEVWTVANRPITVPLIYKLLGNHYTLIELAQYSLHITCWTLLAWSLVTILEARLLQLFGFTTVLLFSISRELYFWNSLLLSESVSHSLMAGCLGAGILIYRRLILQQETVKAPRQLQMGLLLLVLLFFWSMTRDANSYVLLTLAGLIVGSTILWWQTMRQYLSFAGVVVVGCLCIFALQNYHSNQGDRRWQLPLINVLGERILPYEDRTQYFVDQDMPLNENVLQYTNQRAWAFLPDHDIRMEIGDWLNEHGRQTYAVFLLSRPDYSLLKPFERWDQVLTYEYSLAFLADRVETQDFPLWHRVLTCAVYPDDIASCHVRHIEPHEKPVYGFVFPIFMTGIPLLLIALAFAHNGIDKRWLILLGLMIFAYVMGFISYHGDADSVERHSVQVNIIWRVGLWMTLLMAIDWILAKPQGNED